MNSILCDHVQIFLSNRCAHPWKLLAGFPILLLAFLKSWVSSGVAGIVDCKVRRVGEVGSNGKQSNSLKHDIRSCIVYSCELEHIPCAFERVAFYSPEWGEQRKFDWCCWHFMCQPVITFHCEVLTPIQPLFLIPYSSSHVPWDRWV